MTARLCCAIFLLILFLPMLEKNSDVLPPVYLSGKETDPPRAVWSWQNWLDGSFQTEYGKRRESRLGMRSYLVKTFNQLHYSLFHRVVSTSGTNVVIGSDNWLFEKPYVEKVNTPSRDKGKRIDHLVRQLRLLQDRLAELGVAFVFVIAPSKAEIYPEYIPEKLLKKPMAKGAESDYQQARAALSRHGIHHVDGHSLFLREKVEKGYQLFAAGGTHWNKYGAYLAWKEIEAVIGKQSKVPLQVPSLRKIESRTSEPVEADLGLLLNLWDTSLTTAVTDYPIFAEQKAAEKQPSILVIGDSFLFTLIDIIDRAKLSSDVDAWYYFKSHFKYSFGEGDNLGHAASFVSPLERNAIDWRNQLLNKDIVVLVATEYWLPEFDFGFINTALAGIK